MTDLRQLARGRPCLVRIPNVCNGDPETTVLAHYRLIGISGIGLKSPDLIAAWCCSSCHAYIDTPQPEELGARIRLAFANGVFRTINQLVKEGHVRW